MEPEHHPKPGHNNKRKAEENAASVDESSPIIQEFRKHQLDLDHRYEKYERIVKKSRDVTFESKKVIFLLHRISNKLNQESIIAEAEQKLKSIRSTHLRDTALELQGEDHFQFLRAFSPGLQEYVEAVTFLSYLQSGQIASLQDIEIDLCFPLNQPTSEVMETTDQPMIHMPLPHVEYMLGLADLSGELMRKCINSVAQGDFEEPLKVSVIMRELYDGFSSIGNLAGREMCRKLHVLKQSLHKVESACYNLTVRKSEIPKNLEIPKHMLEDVFSSSRQNDFQMDVFDKN